MTKLTPTLLRALLKLAVPKPGVESTDPQNTILAMLVGELMDRVEKSGLPSRGFEKGLVAISEGVMPTELDINALCLMCDGWKAGDRSECSSD